MLPRSVIPVTAVAMFVLSSPASAAGEGPSATPLILEVALAVAVGIALLLRAPASRAFASARRRLSPAAKRRASAVPARDA
jgi:hypothetical protein